MTQEIYWMFENPSKPPRRIALVERFESGRFGFIDEDGNFISRCSLFFDDLDLHLDEEQLEDMIGDPGELGEWWIGVPYSSKEKALAARRAAIENAIHTLEMRIQASTDQTHEDLAEIKRLDNLEKTQEAECTKSIYGERDY